MNADKAQAFFDKISQVNYVIPNHQIDISDYLLELLDFDFVYENDVVKKMDYIIFFNKLYKIVFLIIQDNSKN